MQQLMAILDAINGVLWHQYVLFFLLGVGVLFTIWSGFSQYRALTHGSAVIRGKYDDKRDPGAINHFQALSTALSATVGLGNIAGVAVAVSLGGPGAVFWMWMVGLVGMAIKTTEVTLAMLYRDTSNPDEPHGGPMWVAKRGFAKWGLGGLGTVFGGIFCITLIISTITGGNMFQAWNVAQITSTYFPSIPREGVGILLAIIVGMVIIGGIKRIGAVAGRLVPFMCVLYLLAAAYVLLVNIGSVPAMLVLIVKSAFSPVEAQGAFLGGTFAYALLWGMKRALFSSEAGQGSSPIAHSAAKTDEPVREGVVAGLEPFIDTIVVCTLTALVILSSGAWNREPAAFYEQTPTIVLSTQPVAEFAAAPEPARSGEEWTIAATAVPAGSPLVDRDDVFVFAALAPTEGETPREHAMTGRVRNENGQLTIQWNSTKLPGEPVSVGTQVYKGASPGWVPDTTVLPKKTPDAVRVSKAWRNNDQLFVVVAGDVDVNTSRELHRIVGKAVQPDPDSDTLIVEWTDPHMAPMRPTMPNGEVHLSLPGASLTGYAFDRVRPGMGMLIVTMACWLFAISTMISWSYYGEQGIVYLFGSMAVLPYKVIYCILIIVSTLPFIRTDAQLDAWTALGTGVMLFANIPIMLIFGAQAMKAYHNYIGRLKSGELDRDAHTPAPITDVVEGKDVE